MKFFIFLDCHVCSPLKCGINQSEEVSSLRFSSKKFVPSILSPRVCLLFAITNFSSFSLHSNSRSDLALREINWKAGN